MSDINILQPQVYNMIAAGEVVERPASVIKELIENSIDAGAENIAIEIENGGISLMRVSDDGCGMNKENLAKCILPHATSKIKNPEDLENILSLGFRGEALASIAAVSKMTISVNDGQGGYELTVNGGAISDIVPCGRGKGTTCEIRDLFYNTPARLKFLKKPKQEESMITEAISQLIFSHPDISFNYAADGKTIINSSGGLLNAVYAVYGKDIADNLVYHERSVAGYDLYGYVGKAGFGKHTRNYQTAIINGRVVSNQILSLAAGQAYGTTLMKRCYPVYIVNINMPSDELDVNVHPNKKEVRFKDQNKVFAAMYKFVSSAISFEETKLRLDNNADASAADSVLNHEKPVSPLNTSINSDNFNISGNISAKNSNGDITLCNIKQAVASAENSLNASDYTAFNCDKADKSGDTSLYDKLKEKFSSLPKKDVSFSRPAPCVASPVIKDLNTSLNRTTAANNVKTDRTIYASSSSLIDMVEEELSEDYKVIGQIFRTYLIIERGDKVYFIDQHAMHEKFIYDDYVAQTDKSAIASQELLVPYVFEATAQQYDYIISVVKELRDIGFDIEEFGDLSFKVSAVPYVIKDIDLNMFFNSISGENRLTSASLSEIMKEKLMQRACKSAIKSGDKLTPVQIRRLFAGMDKGIPLQCPHGRPAVISYSRSDFDKLFKRII